MDTLAARRPWSMSALFVWSLLWRLQPTLAGSAERHPAARMQRCFTSGKLLDLTNGSIGLPNCVDSCVPPAERSVQAEGLGFCMLPIARTAAGSKAVVGSVGSRDDLDWFWMILVFRCVIVFSCYY
ncbi:unnamed protein product [Durusdinium trenchii]|uniref:Secreted protein n=1 Tax=Durusdinium trenchii TaxID=1381693 RepID=A0ABP0SVA0_9DINO